MEMKFTFPEVVIPKAFMAQQSDFENWHWQSRFALKSLSQIAAHLSLTSSEITALSQQENNFKVSVTPYYLSLIQNQGLNHPLRKIMIPQADELMPTGQQLLDPLNENDPANRAGPRVIHRYSDRVLFLVTDHCAVYCRYCTRKHFTGKDQVFPRKSEYEQALDYIRSKPGVREVLLSGGDPLTLSDERLEQVLSDLRSIDHVEIIRIGTRMPVVNPYRITNSLVKMLAKYQPVYLMLHYNHPAELTQPSVVALQRLADHGFPLMNQLVLLNGVNNHPAVIQALHRRLLYLRVKPYYMFQCDPSMGTEHLRTSVEDSESVQRQLWGHLSGLAQAQLILDLPAGGGKVALVPDYEMHRTHGVRHYQGWDGQVGSYHNPLNYQHQDPSDVDLYLAEWSELQNQKKSESTTRSSRAYLATNLRTD